MAKKADTEATAAVETTYTVDEFAEAPDTVGATADLIRAAFAVNSKKEATLAEARKIVHDFMAKKKGV